MSAFAAFVPDTEGSSYDDLDISQPDSHPVADAEFYKMLSKVLIGYLNRIKQQEVFGDYVDDADSYYRGQRRNTYGGLGVQKRKVFWQPLGYNPVAEPAGADEGRGSTGRGPTFRYG